MFLNVHHGNMAARTERERDRQMTQEERVTDVCGARGVRSLMKKTAAERRISGWVSVCLNRSVCSAEMKYYSKQLIS